MLPLDIIPIDAFVYLAIAVVWLYIAWRSLLIWRRTGNPIAQFYAVTGLLVYIAATLWGTPLLFTNDPEELRWFYAAGDIMLSIIYAMHVYLIWMAVLRRRVQFALLALPVFVLAAVGITQIMLNANSSEPYILVVDGSLLLTQLPTAINLLVINRLVEGLYFLRAALAAKAPITFRLRYLAIGILYLGIVAIETYNAFVDRSEVEIRAIGFLLLVVFAVFMLVYAISKLSRQPGKA